MSTQFEILISHLFFFKPIKEHSDNIWHFYSPAPHHKNKWFFQSFTKYQDTIYWTINLDTQLEFSLKKRELQTGGERSFHSAETYDISASIQSCIQTLIKAKRDWLTYHRQLLRSLPKSYRFGLIQRRILWSVWHDIYRPDLELTQKEQQALINVFLQQENSVDNLALTATPSLNIYLDYCHVAYLANFKKYKLNIKKKMTGMEMYKAMADGRHEGLVGIDPDSADALKTWYHSGRGGGHPWEICRGGNTTHINLGVLNENDKWFIFLEGNSMGRMLETTQMALAFHEKKMPFRWLQSDDIRLKIGGQDNIGIIPSYYSLHRANQLFDEKDHVFDCIHWNDLGAHKGKVMNFVTWLPLDPLYPSGDRRKN